MSRPTVLVCAVAYVPAYRAGGPVRTIANLVEALGDEFDFRVLTSNTDLGAAEPLDVISDSFQRVGKADVCYLSSRRRGIAAIRKAIGSVEHDLLYINSFHCVEFSIYPLILRRMGMIPHRPTIVAPRGELSQAALNSGGLGRRWKKMVYRRIAACLGLYRNVRWQASSDWEANDIRRIYPTADVWVASDMACIPTAIRKPTAKSAGAARFVYLARIAPIKNLHLVLAALRQVHGDVYFDIYGPVDDPSYWRECRQLMDEMPGNVHVSCHGPVPPERTVFALADSHVFVMPSSSENYGHSIVEALGLSVPVIIGDQTPWRNLEQALAGWDLPVGDQSALVNALQRCVNMDGSEYQDWCEGARQYATARVNSRESINCNRQLFHGATRDVR